MGDLVPFREKIPRREVARLERRIIATRANDRSEKLLLEGRLEDAYDVAEDTVVPRAVRLDYLISARTVDRPHLEMELRVFQSNLLGLVEGSLRRFVRG